MEPRKPFVCYVCSVSDQQLADSFSSISTLAIGSPPCPYLIYCTFSPLPMFSISGRKIKVLKTLQGLRNCPTEAKKSFGWFAWFWFRAGKSKSLIRWNRQKKRRKVGFALQLDFCQNYLLVPIGYFLAKKFPNILLKDKYLSQSSF